MSDQINHIQSIVEDGLNAQQAEMKIMWKEIRALQKDNKSKANIIAVQQALERLEFVFLYSNITLFFLKKTNILMYVCIRKEKLRFHLLISSLSKM